MTIKRVCMDPTGTRRHHSSAPIPCLPCSSCAISSMHIFRGAAISRARRGRSPHRPRPNTPRVSVLPWPRTFVTSCRRVAGTCTRRCLRILPWRLRRRSVRHGGMLRTMGLLSICLASPCNCRANFRCRLSSQRMRLSRSVAFPWVQNVAVPGGSEGGFYS